MVRNRWMAPLIVAATCMSCVDVQGTGPAAVYNLDGRFFDAPWPSDSRGEQTWAGFPNPYDEPVLQAYIDLATEVEGFGTSAAMYVQFDSALDTSVLPTPEESLEIRATVYLVNVDPRSPQWGERTPIQWEFRETEGRYHPANLLSVAPVFGFPLAPNTTYALAITTGAGQSSDAFEARWEEEIGLQLFRDVLFLEGVPLTDIAVATAFTTQDPVNEMARASRFVMEDIAPPSFDRPVEFRYNRGNYSLYRTHFPTPLLQHGERPYNTGGGDFRFDEHGVPLVHSFDDMRLAIATPQDISEPPESGWPAVVYVHGTGGSYRSCCNSSGSREPATYLTDSGMVVLGIEQPLHGTRATPNTLVEAHTFNLLQPTATRSNFRQGAIDILYFGSVLSEGVTFTTDDGQAIPIDPDRVLYMGHSQGGLVGALAIPWMGRDYKGAVLSAAGGQLSITAVTRDSDFDFPALIRSWFQFEEDELLTEMHPLLGLIQHLVEITDPINYGPYWSHQDAGWKDQRPIPVLLTSGVQDELTPWNTSTALAAAARIPVAAPKKAAITPIELRGMSEQWGPLRDNVDGFAGPVTQSLAQWRNGTHYVVFERDDAALTVRTFLESALVGQATIER